MLATYKRVGYGEYLPTTFNIQAHVGTDTMAAAHSSHRAGIPSGAGGYGVQLGTIHFTPHQPGQSTFRSAANPADIQTIRSLHGDALGHLKLTANSQGQIEQQQSYDAFGIALTPLQSNVAGSQGSGINQTPMSQTSKLTSFGELNDQGQVFLRARVLDPSTGRFVSTDPFAGRPMNPLTLHKFAYAHNSPINDVDPSGNMTLGGMMSGLNGLMTLNSIATASYDFIFNPDSDEKPGLFETIIMSMFGAMSSGGDVGAALGATVLGAMPKHGHHTIPMYMCGASGQTLAYINASDHAFIHGQLYLFSEIVNKVPFSGARRRPGAKLKNMERVGRTPVGRKAIFAGLQKFYWGYGFDELPSGKGPETLGSIFLKERKDFVAKPGNHSCK